jgi:hypothetical protein
MVAAGSAEYDPPKPAKGQLPSAAMVLWRKPEEWANLIYDWVSFDCCHPLPSSSLSPASLTMTFDCTGQGEWPHKQYYDILRADRGRRSRTHDWFVLFSRFSSARPRATPRLIHLPRRTPSHNRILSTPRTHPPTVIGRTHQSRQGSSVQRPRRGRRWSQVCLTAVSRRLRVELARGVNFIKLLLNLLYEVGSSHTCKSGSRSSAGRGLSVRRCCPAFLLPVS